MLDTLENPRATIGDNGPPDPFGAIKADIDDLFMEAKNWFDGEEITSPEQAEAVQSLKRMTEMAHKAADSQRVLENKPFDDGKAAVQAKYAELIADTKSVKGKTTKIIEACNKALTGWLRKERARQEEDARVAREAAIKAAAEAQAALDAARADNDLGSQEVAEDAIVQARHASIAATRAEAAKPLAAGIGRAVGLRDNWEVELTDAKAALVHYMTADPDWLRGVLLDRGKLDVRNGRRTIPGFSITNNPVAR
jgi:hypothetical protein